MVVLEKCKSRWGIVAKLGIWARCQSQSYNGGTILHHERKTRGGIGWVLEADGSITETQLLLQRPEIDKNISVAQGSEYLTSRPAPAASQRRRLGATGREARNPHHQSRSHHYNYYHHLGLLSLSLPLQLP